MKINFSGVTDKVDEKLYKFFVAVSPREYRHESPQSLVASGHSISLTDA